MSDTIHPSPFRPYWRRTGFSSEEDPPSWVFFVVTRVSGQYLPVAVASSKSYDGESIQGHLLVATCQRLLTIFSSPANQHIIQAELALVPKYYAECTPEQYELPELPRLGPKRYTTAHQQRMWEFPFISTCLLQGIKWHAQTGWHQAELEYLGTVYRDTSLVWGMVVIDISNLSSIEYGIVAFKVARMIYIDSPQMDRSQDHFPKFGQFRVAEDNRPRRALSAREYIAKFEIEMLDESANQNDLESLDAVGIVSGSAMQNIWPSNDVVSQESDAVSDPRHSDGSPFVMEVDRNYRDSMPAIENRTVDRQIPSPSQNSHLSLEHLEDPLPELLAHANNGSATLVTSVSVCLGWNVKDIEPLVDALLNFQSLQEFIVVSKTDRISDASSFALFVRILRLDPSSSLFRCKLIVSGLFSAGLEKQPWLERSPAWAHDSLVRKAHFQRYPVQQILFRSTVNETDFFTSACLSDALLPPSRFINGLLHALRWLADYHGFSDWQSDSHLLVFSSCSSSLDREISEDSEITPLPAEASANSHAVERNISHVHDLDLTSWTVLVKNGRPWDISEAVHPWIRNGCIRYAFVRPRNRSISIDSPPDNFSVDDLEILGMEDFLAVTSSVRLDFDSAAIDQRLQTICQKIKNDVSPHKIPEGVKLVAVMTEAEVEAELPGFLREAKACK